MIVTGCYRMSSIDLLHTEAKMLQVKEHSELLSAHYFAKCIEPYNACHSITTRDLLKRRLQDTLFTRHRHTVEPVMVETIRK